ncbi:hypothetical protein GCM10025875_10870 [Litorihabitans aurantiacus]|uniref:Uncharacterized protein n=1 Tax=Litorihabitans aurantiacus TaxID=1930061 RepID=A0AA37XDE2_9MICO|nr:hypothetical protein GCM10025875_10870 [Litorihabitans aurantiacus]
MREAEELRAFGALRCELEDRRAGVGVGVDTGAAAGGGLLHPGAELGAGRVHEDRLGGGEDEGDEVARVAAAVGRRLREGGAVAVGQPREESGVVDGDGGVLHARDDLLAEAGLEARELGVQRPQARLLVLPQRDAGAAGVGEEALEQVGGLAIEILVAGGDRLVAGEEPGVEQERVTVGGEQGGDVGRDRVELVPTDRGGVDVEDVQRAPQQRAGALERLDRVDERRRFIVRRDRLPLRALLRETRVDRGAEVLVADLRQRRERVVERRGLGERVARVEVDGRGRSHASILPARAAWTGRQPCCWAPHLG